MLISTINVGLGVVAMARGLEDIVSAKKVCNIIYIYLKILTSYFQDTPGIGKA